MGSLFLHSCFVTTFWMTYAPYAQLFFGWVVIAKLMHRIFPCQLHWSLWSVMKTAIEDLYLPFIFVCRRSKIWTVSYAACRNTAARLCNGSRNIATTWTAARCVDRASSSWGKEIGWQTWSTRLQVQLVICHYWILCHNCSLKGHAVA